MAVAQFGFSPGLVFMRLFFSFGIDESISICLNGFYVMHKILTIPFTNKHFALGIRPFKGIYLYVPRSFLLT